MTFAEIADRYAPSAEDVIGPYSRWPRRRKTMHRRTTAVAAVVAAGIFAHCGGPLVF
jgi:hypothetical protein